MINRIFSICLLSVLILSGKTYAQNNPLYANPTKKIKVYLLGTFHFAQTDETYNVLDEKHQKSIEELCDLVVKQKPNKIFVERQPEYEFKNKVNRLFEKYVENDSLLYKNEIFQVGFRIAKKLGHPKIYQCDHPGMYGRYHKMSLEYAKSNNQLDILNAQAPGTTMRQDDLVNEDSMMYNNSLLDYMRWINSDEVMNTLHANYITTYSQIGSTDYYNYDDDDTLIGAELIADWYKRNIMIYSKIINQLDYTENGILLLMGGDHIPIIRNLFRDNPFFEVVEVKNWLY